ncbi:MAG TPA: bifunctional oligoribonuclease/PAP phosphatase NrnA [bacterium]|nr:bifunctional oligoribonuclease/PAP phosphatase NrnA [bacterium]HPN44003.1 bifunctional oligoribonuclease/PAP phosphatase NrnA [bacterium]
MINWEPVNTFIADKQRFLLSTHLNPDGDGLGSQVALAACLRQMGKTVILKNPNPTPFIFEFLDPAREITCFDSNKDETLLSSVDAVIVVDISDWERLGEMGRILRRLQTPLICIDHHIPTDIMGDVQIIDSSASSTGELIYDYLVYCDAQFNQTMIDALYTCILTDTGSFRFSNTTSKTHTIAADLLKRGAKNLQIFSQVYENYTKNRYYLMGNLLVNMQFACNDKLVWYVVSKELRTKTGVELWEIEGMSELTRNIRNIEISIMFTEMDSGTKVSFRSRGNIPINGLANKFNGGGHKFASGAMVNMDLQTTIDTVIAESQKLFI